MQIEEINTSGQANLSLAFKLRMNIPEMVYFKNVPESDVDKIKEDPASWHIPNNVYAIKKQKGMRITYTVYYDGKDILYCISSFHRRNILSGGMGDLLDENLITLFHNEKCIVMDKFEEIISMYPDYKGLIKIDVLIDNNDTIWYEEIKFGSTLEWYLCLSKLHLDDAELFDIAQVEFKKGFGVGCSVYSFPNFAYEVESSFIYTDDMSFAVNSDDTIVNAWKGLYKNIKDLNLIDICFRNDGGEKERKQWFQMRKRDLV